MGIIKDINKLNKDYIPMVYWMLMQGKEYNVNLIINESIRKDDVQRAYYAQGREPLQMVNELRISAGLYKLNEEENKIKITNVREVNLISGHGAGLAVDLVPDGNWKSPEWKWNIIGKCVKDANDFFRVDLEKLKSNIIWGGNWVLSGGSNDKPHVEMKIV